MNKIDPEYIFTLLVFASMACFAYIVNILVIKTKSSFVAKEIDSGIFWFINLVVFLFLFLLISSIYFVATFWQTASVSNHYALASILGFLIEDEYDPFWANIMTLLWVISVISLLMIPSKLLEPFLRLKWHKALVGTISSKIKSRKWIFLIFIPALLIALLLPLPNVWGNFSSYPFFIYNSGLIITILLTLIAFSKFEYKTNNLSENDNNIIIDIKEKDLWEEKLKEGGVELEYLGLIPATESYNEISSGKDKNFIMRLSTFLKDGGSEELVEGIKDLLRPGGGVRERHKQIRAQDDCGQIESVAITAEALFLRYYTITLLVVPEENIQSIKSQLVEFFDENNDDKNSERFFVLRSEKQYPDNDTSMIILTDPKTLSDSFMNVLISHNKLLLQRIGMIVWWDLHDYTGVLAANMWAIIHRVHRLIELKGRNDLRVMAFIRQAHGEEAELGNFAQDLLPFEFYPESIIDIPVKQNRLVYLYKLNGINADKIKPLPPQVQQHVLLYAVRASIMAGWKTHISSTAICLTSEEMSVFLGRKEQIYGKSEREELKDNIPVSIAGSHALILQLNSRNALALTEIIASLGRTLKNKLQYIGIICTGNSYIDFILKEYAKNEGKFFASQSLIAPKPKKEIVSKHLKKALFETSNTRSDIKTDFQFENEYIEEVLEEIDTDNNLQTSEVRYLLDGKLKVEPEYRSRGGIADHISSPLDTNTSKLISVIAPALGAENEGVRIIIDSHRVTILAYPGRIFYHNGRRFEIPVGNIAHWRNWESTKEIHCRDSIKKHKTYRIRSYYLTDCEFLGENFTTEVLRNFSINLFYKEIVDGYISMSTSYSGKSSETKKTKYDYLYSECFPTKALCIEMPEIPLYSGIISIAEALHYALPVHLGIDENTLEVIAVKDLDIEKQEKSFKGIVIVELYSNGIGLIDSFDIVLLQNIFNGTLSWLKSCTCSDGCSNCLLGEEGRYPKKRQISKQEAIKGLATLVTNYEQN